MPLAKHTLRDLWQITAWISQVLVHLLTRITRVLSRK